METINNITNAASKAIWGEQDPNNPNTTTTTRTSATSTSTTNPTMASGQEPISGQLGNTTAGEPYDRGNAEPLSGTTGPTAGSTYDRSNTMGTPLGAGTTAVGGTSEFGSTTSTNAGPHSSNLANKADPRVDSDRDGSGIGSANTGFYSSTSSNPLTSRGENTTSSTYNTSSSIGGANTSRSGDYSSSERHASNTGAVGTQDTYGDRSASLSHDGSQSINPGPTGSGVGKDTTDASQISRTEGGLKDGVDNTPNSRPFSEFGGNKTVEDPDRTGISFREPGPTPARGLHPIEGQGTMTGAHSHRGSGAFQNTQDTHDTLHKRDHADGADHTQDRRKSSAGGVSARSGSGDAGDAAGHSGKGTPGGMPEVIKKDLEKIKTGKGAPPGGSDAELGLDEAHGGLKDTSKTGGPSAHSDEKLSTMDKIKAKLHHSK